VTTPGFSFPLNPTNPPAPPSGANTPGPGSGGSSDPAGPSDPSPSTDPTPSTYSGSGQSGSGSAPGAGSGSGSGGDGSGDGSGDGNDGSTGDAGGKESVVWFGRGEAGQANEHACALQNWWVRVDRDASSDQPPFYGDNYGRFDLRYNGDDAVLYARCEDSGGNHEVDTLIDFLNGTLTTWHADTLTSADNKGWWYLATASDQRFISLDGRDASVWVYNGIDDYSLFVGKGRLAITNNEYTRYGAIDSSDGSLWVFNEVHQYLMQGGIISTGDTEYSTYASLDGADGSLYIYNPDRYYVMKDGRIVASNADGTRYASLDSNDGSLWIYNDSDHNYLMQGGRIVTTNSSYTSYASLDSNDGSIWAYDSQNNNFLYREGKLQVYLNDGSGINGEIAFDGDGTHVALTYSTATAYLAASIEGGKAFYVDNDGNQGLSYNFDSDTLSVYNASAVANLTSSTLTVNDGSSTGTLWPSGLTLTGSGGGTVSIDCSDFSGTAYFQPVSLCVDGASKTAYILMTDPS